MRRDEKALLDRELTDYQTTCDPGAPWCEVEKRLRRGKLPKNKPVRKKRIPR